LIPPNARCITFKTNSGNIILTVNKSDDTIICVNEDLTKFYDNNDILSGTYIYIQHLNSDTMYRLYVKEKPATIHDCRVARIDRQTKQITYDIKQVECKYECSPILFKCENRLEDLEILWEEANIEGNIFDIIFRTMEVLLIKTDKVHYRILWECIYLTSRRFAYKTFFSVLYSH